MIDLDEFRKAARPALMYCLIVFIGFALHPDVSNEKFFALIGLSGAAYGLREWGKAKGND